MKKIKLCTRCKKLKRIIVEFDENVQTKSVLVADPERYRILLCTDCVREIFKSLWDSISESETNKLAKKYGKKITRITVH